MDIGCCTEGCQRRVGDDQDEPRHSICGWVFDASMHACLTFDPRFTVACLRALSEREHGHGGRRDVLQGDRHVLRVLVLRECRIPCLCTRMSVCCLTTRVFITIAVVMLDVERTHRPEQSARAGHLLIYGISVLQRCADRGCHRVVDVPG